MFMKSDHLLSCVLTTLMNTDEGGNRIVFSIERSHRIAQAEDVQAAVERTDEGSKHVTEDQRQ